MEFLEEDPIQSLRRPPVRKRGRGEAKEDAEPTKKGRAKKNTATKGRKTPVVEVSILNLVFLKWDFIFR